MLLGAQQQGRVRSAVAALEGIAGAITCLASGFLADYVFEPAMLSKGRLAGLLGNVLGVGKSRGMGLMFVLCGVLCCCLCAASAMSSRLRHLGNDVPDR